MQKQSDARALRTSLSESESDRMGFPFISLEYFGEVRLIRMQFTLWFRISARQS